MEAWYAHFFTRISLAAFLRIIPTNPVMVSASPYVYACCFQCFAAINNTIITHLCYVRVYVHKSLQGE